MVLEIGNDFKSKKMKIKKFTLNQTLKRIDGIRLPEKYLMDLSYPQEAQIININLIEIETNENPSDIILIVKSKGERKLFPLCVYKTELVFLNNKYCWNTKEKQDFIFNTLDFSIIVEGDISEFTMDFFYSTDQKEPYILFERSY